jgi:hypothetical protein
MTAFSILRYHTSFGEEVEGLTIWPRHKADGTTTHVHVILWKGPSVSLPTQWGMPFARGYHVPEPFRTSRGGRWTMRRASVRQFFQAASR